MKNKFKKAACFFLSIVATLFFSNSIHASDSILHAHGESCVYHCELDVISPTDPFVPYHEHIDHAGSEACKHSCTQPENNHSSSHKELTPNEVQSFIEAFKNASSDEELNAIIAEHYGISASNVDIAEMRNFAKTVGDDCLDSNLVKEYAAISSHEELVNFIADYADVSVVAAQELYTENPNAELNGFWDLFCNHSYLAVGCEGNHYGASDCKVWCIQTAICMNSKCSSVTEVTIRETAHNWSVGWCGQTCKECGIVEMFHEDGGCWYCS